eukprot:2963469-Rhodomonas_salina.1
MGLPCFVSKLLNQVLSGSLYDVEETPQLVVPWNPVCVIETVTAGADCRMSPLVTGIWNLKVELELVPNNAMVLPGRIVIVAVPVAPSHTALPSTDVFVACDKPVV